MSTTTHSFQPGDRVSFDAHGTTRYGRIIRPIVDSFLFKGEWYWVKIDSGVSGKFHAESLTLVEKETAR